MKPLLHIISAFVIIGFLAADSIAQIAAPPAATLPESLTPPPSESPRINGAKVFGVRPGSPFLYLIPASGVRPMTFEADGLPSGLTLDAKSGQITGTVSALGEFKVTLRAKNAKGKAERAFKIVVGDDILLTPPMGWNSWYIYSEAVSADLVRKTAQAMVSSGLSQHGWTYVNIDDCWQGPRGGPFNALQGNSKFPDMAALCADVHALGLKIGLYSSPWISSYAGFRGGSAPNEAGNYESSCLPPDRRIQPDQIFGRYPLFERFKANRFGPVAFYDQDAKQWGAWGFDYMKHDWNPIDAPTIELLAKSLRQSGRDIAFSVSNGAKTDVAKELMANAQVWRTGGDVSDSWGSITHRFTTSDWAPFTTPGHWPDPDMLQVGLLGVPNTKGKMQPTHLTADEQYAHVSLWALMSAPLLISCDLTQLDPFTLGLLTNDEVIDIDQDPLGTFATRLAGAEKLQEQEIFFKPLEDGSMAVGLFNLAATPKPVSMDFAPLKLSGKQKVRDVWRQKDLGEASDTYSAEVPGHGVLLLRLSPVK